MKIIDAHTHLPGRSFGGKPKSGGQLRAEFEAEGLAGAWLMTTDGLLGEPERHNDILAEAVSDHRDFFIPFCTVAPNQGETACLKEIDRAAKDLEMVGLKLHPWLQAFSMTYPVIEAVFRRAAQLGMPIILHDGTPPYSAPLQIAYVAEKVPEARVILGHCGLDDLYEEAIAACLRLPNIYLCLCSLSAGYAREVIRRVPAERLLFGSDAGFFPRGVMQAAAKIDASGAMPDVLEMIFHRNAARFFPDLSLNHSV